MLVESMTPPAKLVSCWVQRLCRTNDIPASIMVTATYELSFPLVCHSRYFLLTILPRFSLPFTLTAYMHTKAPIRCEHHWSDLRESGGSDGRARPSRKCARDEGNIRTHESQRLPNRCSHRGWPWYVRYTSFFYRDTLRFINHFIFKMTGFLICKSMNTTKSF